jgi:RND family efflux transporter MFP subunit
MLPGPRPLRLAAVFLAAVLGIGGCGERKAPKKAAGPLPTLITTAVVERRSIEVREQTVGTLENLVDPTVRAEVAGRLVRVAAPVGKAVRKGDVLAELDPVDFEIQSRADAAEVARLNALLANQERVVSRQQQLVEQRFISQNALEDALAQRDALREQRAAARARADAGKRALGKSRVLAPIDGRVETQIVAVGDYVKVGDPLVKLVGTRELRAHLPFPESAGPRLRLGQQVRLSSPFAPGRVVESTISDIRPTVTETSRALDVLVRFAVPDESLLGGGTVNAEVITATRPDALVVPEQSVVLRPAGKVVYVVADGRVRQRAVETGYKRDGMVEIERGLAPGEIVAVEGAGFLTDGGPVSVPPSGSRGSAPQINGNGKPADANGS